MTFSCRRTAALFLVVLSATITIVVLSTGQPTPAHASHSGGADFFLIDMDPTGNTATSIGSIESCGRVNENNILDADEAAVDAIDIDIVTGPTGIPASNPAIAYSTKLVYPAPSIRVIGHDQNFLLLSAPGSVPWGVVPTLPDTDGVFLAELVDNGGIPTAESGPGVLERVTLQTIPGASSGLHTLSLETAAHIDDLNNPQAPDNEILASGLLADKVIPSSFVAIDVPCPVAQGDLKVSAVSISGPLAVLENVPFNVSIAVAIHNNGPAVTAFNADIIIGERDPGICSVSTTSIPDVMVPPSVSVPLNFTLSATCVDPGAGGLSIRAGVQPDDLGLLDPNPLNNTLDSDFAVVEVFVAEDADMDGLLEGLDNCPDDANPNQADFDQDGVGDACDPCPDTPTGAEVDSIGCSLAQVDADGDGQCDEDAPSTGPPPGCLRSVAVGGIAGVLDARAAASASADHSASTPPIAALAVAAAAGALFATAMRIRRRAR